MTYRSKAGLKTILAQRVESNVVGGVSAEDVRETLNDLVDSYAQGPEPSAAVVVAARGVCLPDPWRVGSC